MTVTYNRNHNCDQKTKTATNVTPLPPPARHGYLHLLRVPLLQTRQGHPGGAGGGLPGGGGGPPPRVEGGPGAVNRKEVGASGVREREVPRGVR